MAESLKSLNSALDNVQSDRLKDREKGLSDLRYALSLNRGSSRLSQSISNKSVHSACETLFQVVSSERSTYIKAKKSSHKESSASRLKSCASTIRLMIETLVSSMRHKTVQALLGHITQTLPTADGGFCTPLALDFSKSLRAILDYQPHVEHLGHDTWSNLVEFCTNGLDTYADSLQASNTSFSNGGSSALLSSEYASSTAAGNKSSQDSLDSSIELVGCLQSLASASNSPLLEKAPEILQRVTHFISNSGSRMTGHHAAFKAINLCLKVLSTHSKKLMTWALKEIIPHIKNLWSRKKQPALRDEMLATLVYARAHLIAIGQDAHDEDFVQTVELLLDTMSTEYFESRERGHLSLDHLALWTKNRPSMDVMPMQGSTFSLRVVTKDTEHNWTTLYFLAFLTNWVDSRRSPELASSPTEELRSPKRLRMASRLLDLTNYSRSIVSAEKLTYNLRIIAFIIDQRELSETEWGGITELIGRAAGHENSEASSWAMVCAANLALQTKEMNTSDDIWLKIWHIGTRSLSSPSHCRAACHVMDSLLCAERVMFADVSDSTEAIVTSASLNGPGSISDSSLSMWLTILEHRSANLSIQRGNEGYEKLLEWICNNWKPSEFENRSYSNRLCRESSAKNLEGAFASILTKRLTPPTPAPLAELQTLGEAWLFQLLHQPLVDFLLLTNTESRTVPKARSNYFEIRLDSASDSRYVVTSGTVILKFFTSELEKLSKAWHDITMHRASTINDDMMQVVFSFCVLGILVANNLQPMHTERSSELLLRLSELGTRIFSYAGGAEATKISVLLHTISQFLPKPLTNDNASMYDHVRHIINPLLEPFAEMLECVREQSQNIDMENLADFDDLEFEGEYTKSSKLRLDRRQDAARCSERSFLGSVTCYVQFLHALSNEPAVELEDVCSKVPSTFTRYITSLSPEDLISARPILKMILSAYEVRAEDVAPLLEMLSPVLLNPYEWNRCEVALGLCVDVMVATASVWADSSHASAADLGGQLYEWFLGTAQDNRILSTSLQLGITDLLYKLLDFDVSYAENTSMRSVRTYLLKVLENGNLEVQYCISLRLVALFNSFVLSQHELIFDDILESLPAELEHEEGICMRMLVFTQIGSSWKSLLRRCLFHIMETAGLIPNIAPHAKHCVQLITKQLGLPDARRVFRLFCPQLLHTWLESNALNTIAYGIFGYPSLKSMLESAKSQFLSQLLMLGSTEQLSDLENELNMSVKDLLVTSFGQAVAYGIAKDLSMQGTEGVQIHATEARIRDLLGKHQYLDLLIRELPIIVGHIFIRLEQEENIEKTLGKRQEYEYAAKALSTIKDISHSTTALSQTQQPSFKSKLLLDEIERICRRISKKPVEIWTAPLILRVARMLFEDAHDAFGPLHACRTIQRIRLLVCLAGENATTGYPVEMLIHGLRPFVTDKQCADDAIGLFQYLVESGKAHFLHNPRLLAGTSLILMLSLRDLLNSTQDSTTQGAQHRKVLSKAERFRTWLGHYMQSFRPGSMQKTSIDKMHAMLRSAANINGPGGASADSDESNLLVHLLDTINAGEDEVIYERFAVACLTSLCKDFCCPRSFREDVLGADEAASRYAVALWKTLRFQNTSSSYLVWAAKSLGRAYGYNGLLDPEIVQETNIKELVRDQKTLLNLNYASASNTSIIHSLVDILWDDRPAIAGMAEIALHQIISNLGGSVDAAIVESTVPSSVVDSLPQLANVTSTSNGFQDRDITQAFSRIEDPFKDWIRGVAVATAKLSDSEPVLGAAIPLLRDVDGLAERLFPFIIHVCLFSTSSTSERSSRREQLSKAFSECLKVRTEHSEPHLKTLINATLYLRTQPRPEERTVSDRTEWLAIDFSEMAAAAHHCNMHKTALQLLELDLSKDLRGSSKRSSVSNISRNVNVPTELFLSIFKELDEPDSFYGVEQESDLESIASRLDYEGDNMQSLLLRGAKMDSQFRENQIDHSDQAAAIIQSLVKLGLSSITSSLASTRQQSKIRQSVMNSMITSSMKLRQWDIATPPALKSPESLVYRTFQSLHSFKDLASAQKSISDGLLEVTKQITDVHWAGSTLHSSFTSLSALTEVGDMLASQGNMEIFETWEKLLERDSWIAGYRQEHISLVLSSREAFCGILSHDTSLQESLRMSARDSRILEIRVDLSVAQTRRKLDALQDALSSVTYLSSLSVPSMANFNLKFHSSVNRETADILWQRDQLVASIKTLQSISQAPDFENQIVPVGGAGLLADIAHRVSYARLEKPDDILNNYLRPALKRLKEVRHGSEAGKVFHEYAMYCHKQLDNPDGIQELRRSERFKWQRRAELRDLKAAMSTVKNDPATRKEYENVKKWLNLDEQENQRLRDAREQFLRSSLEHYLRSLAACDEFDTNVIRFVTIWLGNSENATANKPVRGYQSRVPSKKFASLMNQLASRLQETENEFQSLLSTIVMRVCQDHPYHGMYHIYAGSKTSGGNDSQARSRNGAASKLAKKLEKNGHTSRVWMSVHKSNELYNKMAKLRTEETRQGAKLSMKQFEPSKAVERDVPQLKVPPITMAIAIRDDLDYSNVPTVVGFKPNITIPSGISAPKLVTALASNGVQYRQLFKGGTDDLRQDAIMEQVFEQVTSLLEANKATRHRNLRIRTYKVVPLDATSGAIEFVEPTMSLNDFLIEAHHRYHPKEMKWKACRDKMSDVADLDHSARLKEFQSIKARFSPVLRHFFFERFLDPDEWFERRLAYTRSTAAISILGHVLGLGDRHCQNILLDTKTGEVVHIDLGVAFEAGRILPKPETVPFRLTRDVVDGFGVFKTEGVFRRCCEFALEAMRGNKDTILTLLNVLRYDPLYSWSVSPLRAKRLQNDQESRMLEAKADSTVPSRAGSTRSSFAVPERAKEDPEPLMEDPKESESSEADRALSTVEKKLSTTLSVSATVNELIQQATDDKNLAVLFHGWAPYA